MARCCHMQCDHELRTARQREIVFRYLLETAADQIENLRSGPNSKFSDSQLEQLATRLRQHSNLGCP